MVTVNQSRLPASSLLSFQHNGKDAIAQPNGILELGVPSYSEVARELRHVPRAMQIEGRPYSFPHPRAGILGIRLRLRLQLEKKED